jgi:F-type H+-transporting ATPase subunit delta
MMVDAAARRYAGALRVALGPQRASAAQALLAEMARAVAESPDLGAALRHPLVSAQAKRRVLERLFGPPRPGGEAFTPELGAFLETLFDNGRGHELAAASQALADILDREAGRLRGEVVSAVPLADDAFARLTTLLGRRLGGTVVLDRRVDPAVIGGLEVRVGGRLLDLTVRRRLQGMRRALIAGGPGTERGKGS